jgi:isopropylmalate/homocitrate/citramalate synthase
MEEANEIVETVQNIFDIVSREFNAAVPGMTAGQWIGLDADARARLALQSRKQVDRLKAVFDRVQCDIDAVECGEIPAAEIAAATSAVHAEVARRRATNDSLRALLRDAQALARDASADVAGTDPSQTAASAAAAPAMKHE